MRDLLITSWFLNNRSFSDFSSFNVPTIEKKGNSIHIKAPAKINLFLRINNKYKDGYHHIETVYSSITLYDYIILFKLKKREYALICNVQKIINAKNVAFRVATYLINKYRIKGGIGIYIHKGIPIGSGLGGESSDAVFTYLGFHKLFSIPVNVETAQKELLEFGTDTQFFLHGGTALGIGKPDKIIPIDPNQYITNNNLLFPYKRFNSNMLVLIIYPFINKKTKKMYEEFDSQKFNRQTKTNIFLYNDFKDILCTKYQKIKIILDIIKNMGYSEYCNISGSGSTIYVLLKNYKEVVKVWQDICRKSTTEISGACARFTKTWENIFY